MSESTRRGFLVLAGAAAASVGAAVVAANAAAGKPATPLRSRVGGPLVVHVKDVRKGRCRCSWASAR
jgi:hypothetical protein